MGLERLEAELDESAARLRGLPLFFCCEYIYIMIDVVLSCGALKSPDDPNDFIFERIACAPRGTYFAELPQECDLRQINRAARNQGGRSTCAAFAAAVIKEIQEYKDCKFDKLMSPEFIYFHRDNKPTGGMYGRNVFQILQKIGCVPEDDYPYYDDESAPQPDNELYCTASRYRIANYARVTTIIGLKRALLELGPCYIQLPLYSMDTHFWRPEPIFNGQSKATCRPVVSIAASGDMLSSEKNVDLDTTLNDNETENIGIMLDETPPGGGHALVVVGYNHEGFILVNSWGTEWGTEGSVVFPYEDWALHWECWASIDEKTHTSPVCVSKKAGSVVSRRERKKNSISIESITRHLSVKTKSKKSKPRRHSDQYSRSKDRESSDDFDDAKCLIM